MDTRLTEVLVCPICKGPLTFNAQHEELHCAKCALAFPVIDEIPSMLVNEARALTPEECEKARVKPVQE